MKRLTVIALALCALAGLTGQFYPQSHDMIGREIAPQPNGGIAWDWGGIELWGDPGLFFCADSGHMADGQGQAIDWAQYYRDNPGSLQPLPESFHWVHDWHNPLADWYPSLVVEC